MRRLIAVLCAMGASLMLASGASAASWWGLNDSSVTAGQLGAGTAAAGSLDLGANSARIGLNWAWVQPTRTTPDFSTFDAIYKADISVGIHPLITLVGSPSWAWPSGATCATGSTCVYPPSTADNADWQAIAADVARRYPQAAGIEIWNEPNMSWEWASGPDPARYTQLLKLAYTAIKGVNPNMPVIGGALATDLDSTATSTADPLPQFLQAMYQNGARGSMDGISIHPYPGAVDLQFADRALSDTTDIRDANGDRVPVWVTETGLSVTQGFTTDQQAEVDAELVRELRAYPGLGGVYLSTLVEPPVGGDGLGLITPALSLTPGFCTVATAAGSSFVCPSNVIVPTAGTTQQGRWQAQMLLQAAANAAIAYRAAHGSYTGATSAALNAIDPRISTTAADGTPAGPSADPSHIGVYVLSPTAILLCNASQADLSYCTGSSQTGIWKWWQATGSVYSAAYVAMH